MRSMIVGFMADPGDSQAEVVHWASSSMKLLDHIEIQAGTLSNFQDLWLVQQTVLHKHNGKILDQAKALGRPVVILERIDGCQITGKTRRYIDHPNVVAVIKNTMAKPNSLHNRHGTRRIHVHELHQDSESTVGGPINLDGDLSDDLLRKVVTGFTFGSYKLVREGCWNLPWKDTRTIRAGFWGTVEYDREELLTEHRTSLVDRLNSIEGCVAKPGRPYDRQTYIRMMTISEAVVSPWGYGESCYRDYEALLCGAVLIKPHTPWMIERTGIYDWGPQVGSIQWCRPDWKDLEAVIAQAQRVPEETRQNTRVKLEGYTGASTVAGRLGKILDAALNSWRTQTPFVL
jgi:hypothetical protein